MEHQLSWLEWGCRLGLEQPVEAAAVPSGWGAPGGRRRGGGRLYVRRLGRAQQHEGDQGDRALGVHGVVGVPIKRVIWRVCLIQQKAPGSFAGRIAQHRDQLGDVLRSGGGNDAELRRHPALGIDAAASEGCGDAPAVTKLTMNRALDLRVLELLTARLCHELSGPIAAIGNGVELLAEGDADFAGEALTLLTHSARRAADRLQFYRFAYGFGGDDTAGPAPYELAAKFFGGLPVGCDYRESVRALPLDRQKLGCNLLVVGAEALIRGGRLALDVTSAGVQLDAFGETVLLPPEQAAALRLEPSVGALTTRTVNAYFAGLLARACGLRLVAATELGRIRLWSIACDA